MAVRVTQYWTDAPPSGIYEGLVDSGILSKTAAEKQISVLTNRASSALKKPTIQSKATTKRLYPTKIVSNPPIPFSQYRPNTSVKRTAIETDLSTSSYASSRLSPPSCSTPKYEIDVNVQHLLRTLGTGKTASTSRHEAKALLKDLETVSDDTDVKNSEHVSPSEQASIYSQLLSSYWIIWNNLTLQIKAYNEDHALISQKLKCFFKEYLEKQPEISRKYEEQIMQMTKELGALKQELSSMRNNNHELQETLRQKNSEIDRLAVDFDREHQNLNVLKERENDLLYKIDEQKVQIDELTFRYGKLEEAKESISRELSRKDEIIENCNSTITSHEKLISKYEEHGAGFKPLYTSTLNELNQLKCAFEAQSSELVQLKQKTETCEIGTDPVITLIESPEKGRSGKKKIEKKRALTKTKAGSSSVYDSGNKDANRKSKNAILLTINLEDVSASNPGSSTSSATFKEANESVALATSSAPEIQISLCEKSSEVTLTTSKRSLNSNHSIRNSHSEPILEKHNPQLPDDYDVPSDFIMKAETSALVNYVYHLLPNPVTEPSGCSGADFLVKQIKQRCEIKSFSWTLDLVILILRNGFQFDTFASDSVQFLDIVTKVIMDSGKNPQIVDRIRANLMLSVSHYRTRSNAIDFFMSFVSGEYGVTEYRFFNVLFGLCFKAIYPSIDRMLEDSNLTDDFSYFYLHKSFCDQICQVMLHMDGFPEKNMVCIEKELSGVEPVDFIPFFAFAKEIMKLFRSVHESFHMKIKTVLKIIGTAYMGSMTRERFTDFLGIVDPKLDESGVKSLWEKVELQATSFEQREYAYPVLLKVSGNFHDLARCISELPVSDNFEQKFGVLSEPAMTLFFFLRKRYSDWLPKFLSHVSARMRERLVPYVVKMRNAFLSCDVSTALMCYRYVMQFLDLKLTEENPFQIITTSLTNDDVARIINQIMMRECLASILLPVNVGIAESQLVSDELRRRARKLPNK